MSRSAEAVRVTDLLVIGAGLGGCAVALAAARAGIKVTLLNSAQDFNSSASYMAQGGILYRGKADSLQSYMDDFQQAGDHIVNPQAVRQIYHYGPELLDEILIGELQIPFNRTPQGDIDLTREAAHSRKRIAHVKDHTGKAIQEQFRKKIKNTTNIELISGATAVDLITLAHHSLDDLHIYEPITCTGAYVFFQDSGKVHPVLAKQTVLATGGLGCIYLHTSNSETARGDGYAMAYRAGGRIMNMEYIQFHPTTFFSTNGERFLITEALRGEGGVLRNRDGENFMPRYHEMASLAPRDIVSRSIIKEMNRTESACVYLDITHKDGDWIKDRFPTIYQRCLEHKVDMTQEPIPVVPAAHYECGGVAVDTLSNTTIKRLKTVGEVACTGLHGANRLASSSLMECLVYGTLAGRDCADKIRLNNFIIPRVEQWRGEQESIDPDLIREDMLIVQHTMWNYVGIVRTKKKLERAFGIFQKLCYDIEQFYAHSQLDNNLIGLRNMATTSQMVLHAARLNRESRGCHYRIN